MFAIVALMCADYVSVNRSMRIIDPCLLSLNQSVIYYYTGQRVPANNAQRFECTMSYIELVITIGQNTARNIVLKNFHTVTLPDSFKGWAL